MEPNEAGYALGWEPSLIMDADLYRSPLPLTSPLSLQGRRRAKGVGWYLEATGGSHNHVGSFAQMFGLEQLVFAPDHHLVFESHARAQRTELVHDLNRQLARGCHYQREDACVLAPRGTPISHLACAHGIGSCIREGCSLQRLARVFCNVPNISMTPRVEVMRGRSMCGKTKAHFPVNRAGQVEGDSTLPRGYCDTL